MNLHRVAQFKYDDTWEMVITYGSSPVDVNNNNRWYPDLLHMTPFYNTEACTTLLYTA